MIRAVIIEDEPLLRETNRMLLQRNFHDIEVVAEAATVEEGVRCIKEFEPQLVLTDIELDGGNCFQILQRCKPFTFKPVFITAYNQYAIKAIKFNAVDYILKPVNEYEFCHAIQQAIDHIEHDEVVMQTERFIDHYAHGIQGKKMLLRTVDALHVIDVRDIVYCKSDNSYTTFFLNDAREIIVSKSIKEYYDILEDFGFLRPHQSYLVNIHAIDKIDKRDGQFIVMKNGVDIPVSLRRRQMVVDALDNL